MMMNNIAKKDPSGLWCLFIGALFFLNPTYHIIDVLPDTIGYFLFFIGLAKLAAINDEAMEARKGFLWLFILTAAKLCLCLIVPYSTDMVILLCAFVFAIAETILFVPAALRMFKALEFLDMRLGCTAAGGLKNRKKTVSVESIRNLTVAAWIVRALCTVLPLLPSLATSGNTVMDSSEEDMAGFAFILISLAVGIIYLAVALPWIIRFDRYIKGITDDKDCCLKIDSMYNEWAVKNEVRIVSGRMNCVMLLLIAAAVLMFNMYVDGVNIFPTGIGALLVLAAFVLLKSHGKAVCISGGISCVLWAVMSVVGEYLQMDYKQNNYRPGSAAHMIGKAPEMYLKMEICGYIEAALAAVSMLLMLLIFTRALDAHAKKYAFYNTAEKKRFDRCLIPVIILWVLAVLMSAAIMPLLKIFAEIWLINGLIIICLTVFMIRAYNILYDGIYLKLHD